MDRLGQDIRQSLRSLRRAPAFAVTATIILALGIGMSVAMFTVFRTVLVRRLPVADQDHIVVLWTYRDPAVEAAGSTKELNTIRRQSRTMRDIAGVAHWPASPGPILEGDRSVPLNRSLVTGNFFDVLGVKPVLGRLLHSSDDAVGDFKMSGANSSQVLVLSYAAWQGKFGGDPSIIGRHLVEPYSRWDYTVVGVAPPGLDYPAGVEYWAPIWGGWQGGVSTIAVARLNPNTSLSAARDEYFSIANRLEPDWHWTGAHAATFTETVLGNITPILSVLMAAVGVLLLIACLNVGNLLLLRASARGREIAVRRALGADYADIVRQSPSRPCSSPLPAAWSVWHWRRHSSACSSGSHRLSSRGSTKCSSLARQSRRRSSSRRSRSCSSASHPRSSLRIRISPARFAPTHGPAERRAAAATRASCSSRHRSPSRC